MTQPTDPTRATTERQLEPRETDESSLARVVEALREIIARSSPLTWADMEQRLTLINVRAREALSLLSPEGGGKEDAKPIRLDLALGACQVAAKSTDLSTAQAFARTAIDFLTGDYEPLDED